MKTLLLLAAVILCSAFHAKAECVRGYYRSSGTYVAPYYRSTANSIACDNLSYRYSTPRYSDSWSINGSSTRLGNSVYHNYYTSDGGYLSGTVTTYGDTTYVSISGW